MGKPSQQLSRQSSTTLNTTSSKSNMNIPPISSQKSIRVKRKRQQKTNETIKKLFKQLRRESKLNSQANSCNNSIIDLDESNILNNTVMTDNVSIIQIDDVSNTTANENVQNKTPQSIKTKTIVIKDDEPSTSTPKNIYSLHHSTPIKKKPSMDELILSINNNLINEMNKTKEINASSFMTIDLTNESGLSRSTQPTVIDLDNTNDQQDCVLTSVSQASSMSGDSDVTILRRPAKRRSITSQIKTGLANLNSNQKDKLLAFISENLFNGCSIPSKIQPRAPENAEDTYIRDVIVGRKLSRNSIGSNVYNPDKYVNKTGLRMVVIDGSNVAISHGNHRQFSVNGLKIVIDYFLSRGHAVKAFVPKFRNKHGKSTNPQLLCDLERAGHVIFTPSREVRGRDITSYDDRYIIQCAAEFEGIIVSNDYFRDLIHENPRWADVINSRVLQYNWVNNMIMFPRDPMGRNGPTLEQFLKMPSNVNKRKGEIL